MLPTSGPSGSKFIQLASEDCAYLLTLIETMDKDIVYTARQRSYTLPKLIKIQADARSGQLAWQDVEYLLELIEDDDLPEVEQQRLMTQEKLLEIQQLQARARESARSIEQQRELRRSRRKGLQSHFERTGPVHE